MIWCAIVEIGSDLAGDELVRSVHAHMRPFKGGSIGGVTVVPGVTLRRAETAERDLAFVVEAVVKAANDLEFIAKTMHEERDPQYAPAGIAVNVDQATHESDLSRVVAGATITVPVALYLLAVWFLHVRPHENPPFRGTLLPLGAVVVLLMTFTGQPVVSTGLVLTVVVAIAVVHGARSLGEVVVERDDRANPPPP